MVKGLKKNLMLTMAVSALGATLIAGGSFALFTSQATNAGNTFTSGKVSISDTTGGAITAQEVNFNNLAPGDTKTLTLTVTNNGSLDEWVKLDDVATNASKSGDLFGGPTPIGLTLDTKVVKLAPGASTTFNVTYLFPLAADNSYAEKGGSFSVIVDAVQARNNSNATDTAPLAWN